MWNAHFWPSLSLKRKAPEALRSVCRGASMGRNCLVGKEILATFTAETKTLSKAMRRFLYAVMCALAVVTARAQKTVTTEGAWCWFADPRALHYQNEAGTIDASWIGYIDVHGAIRATQMDFLTGRQSEVLVRSYFQPDDHNNPTFLVLPDERVLIIYSRHTDEPAFYYRVSKVAGDITTLGDEKKIVTANNTTYPSPFILSDDPTHFYLCWRGINWHPTVARITLPDDNDDVTVDWGPYQMVQSTGARPYAKYYSNGKDKLYMTYTTGHPDNEQPNWIYFNVISINADSATGECNPTLEDINGTQLSTISDGAFNVSKTSSYMTSYPLTVVDAPSSYRDWVWQIALDEEERPRIAMVRITSGKDQHEYYYARWTGSEWALTDVCDGGAKFHSSATEYCYSGGMALDQQDPSTLYVSKPTTGTYGSVHEIWKYTISDEGVIESEEQVTTNSQKNNVRPFVLPNSQGSPLRLAWMNGDYYYWMVKTSYPLGYPTGIMADYILPEAEEALEPDYATSLADAGGTWTLSFDCSLPSDAYYGELITTDVLTYGVGESTVCPYIQLADATYTSPCQLYNSDNWALNSSGTNGDYWPTQLGTVNFTLTYDGTTLVTYRDGMLDQKVEADLSALSLTDGNLGTAVSNVTILRGALTPMQVAALLRIEALNSLVVPAQTRTDIVLPSEVGSTDITWTSSAEDIIATDGTYSAPVTQTTVTLTATAGGAERTFEVTALPRDTEASIRARYTFETTDVATTDGTTTVSDLSGNGMDMTVMGSATIDGTLNLTANTASGFSTNGYGVVPAEIMDSLRSYTFMFDANATSLSSAPRFYDFGFSSGNSLFCRANALCAGIKYAGGTTTMTSASTTLSTGTQYNICVTYDARTQTTRIYVDGTCVAAGTENVREAYELALAGTCDRNYVGRTQWWESSVKSDNVDFVGTIDNLTIYDIALTEEEVRTMLGLKVEDETLNTDMSDRVENRDFEASYSVLSGTGVASDRAIYQPLSWGVTYTDGNSYDMSVLTSSDLYASLFSDVPVCGGEASYRVRQNWGTSTISLTQEIDSLPAALYRLGSSVWSSGSGGQASITATVDADVSTGVATSSDATEWQTASATFFVNGQQTVTIALNAVHTSNGNTKFLGFDDVTLYDITPNGTSAQLAALLASMLPRAEELAALLPTDATLADAVAQAQAATEDDDSDSLYATYALLKAAMAAAEETVTPVTPVTAPQATDTEAYDLTGRRAPANAKGVIIENGKKMLR